MPEDIDNERWVFVCQDEECGMVDDVGITDNIDNGCPMCGGKLKMVLASEVPDAVLD